MTEWTPGDERVLKQVVEELHAAQNHLNHGNRVALLTSALEKLVHLVASLLWRFQ